MSANSAHSDDDLMSLDFTLPGAIPGGGPARAEAQVRASDVCKRAEELRAAGDPAEACRVLEATVDAGASGDGERILRLLLDLYQALGRREVFEARALDFAARFEKSPPAWVEAETSTPDTTSERALLSSLAGTLNERARAPLRQILDACAKHPVRLELSRIVDADDAGCALLLDTLTGTRRIGGRCALAGAAHLAEIVAARLRGGKRTHESGWLLLLELYQRLGCQEAFEAAALDYAVRFEVSPPSWEAARVGDCEN